MVTSTLRERSKTIIGYEAPRSIDWELWIDFLVISSRDLTSCDYFLLEKLKYIVYHDSTRTTEELQAINEDSLQRVYENMIMRLNFVLGERGGTFEHRVN